MVINLLDWIWIAISSVLTGAAIVTILEKFFECKLKSLESCLWGGIVFTTVYAEIFSLFYRVGTLATLGLLCLTIFSAVLLYVSMGRVEGIKTGMHGFCGKKTVLRSWQSVMILIIGVFFLAISASTPYLGDTYMYHIQAVEWIEKYGVVKGLGNLHFRFAYNSAFECLAALYSFRGLLGRSLHAANGFYAFCMVSYCVVTFKWRPRQRILVSDLLKLATLIYVFGRLSSYGSADTDPLVMHCICYVFIKWFELLEKRERQIEKYGLLCMIGVYACTVKLSAGLIILLILYPLILLIQKGNWKTIVCFMFMGVIIVTPYLIRNVLISGYLLYPYTALDFFQVDWKMPVSIAKVDREGIIVWGRGIEDLENAMDLSFVEWLPIWFSKLTVLRQMLFLLDVISALIFLLHCVKQFFGHEEWQDVDFICFVSIACFVFWMASAPLMRYGEMYTWILLIAVVGSYASVQKLLGIGACAVLACEMYAAVNLTLTDVGLFMPADYKNFSVTGHETEISYEDGRQVIIYTPNENAMSDYYRFPETPEEGQLDDLRFRGDQIKDGFRSAEMENADAK